MQLVHETLESVTAVQREILVQLRGMQEHHHTRGKT